MPLRSHSLHRASRRDGGGHCHPAGVRQRADGGLQHQHLARGDENRPTVNHYRPVGVGGHPPADGGSGANTISQALEYTPGVYSSFGGGATRFDAISLRGYHGGDVDNLFLDGMRLMSDGGSHNVLQIDPWFIERVDVIRGPSSALYGQSVPGGVVNLTSKRPQFSQQGHIRLTGGTQNTKGAAFDYTDAIKMTSGHGG
ncbi:ferrioxamine receptor [Klebsiella pneumoniae]|uniref:Ferrioxamine receptor n=1 Tax=Klebsiella pneumoniae TaxID=573 RepID=A0A2X3F1P4_KLEPN|nr:ferrioxamine receptor [Klebsiella pneumoniae]